MTEKPSSQYFYQGSAEIPDTPDTLGTIKYAIKSLKS